MSRLDDAIANVAYILDTLMVYRNIAETGNCNTCKDKDCQWRPKTGQLVRYNCPHYKAGKTMNNAEKFKQIFGLYATELWAMPEEMFLEWLNAEAPEKQTADKCCKTCRYRNREEWEEPCNECYRGFSLANEYEDCYEAEEES